VPRVPYALILLAASVLLGAYYVTFVEASRGSKGVVGATVVTALAIWWWYPQGFLVSTLLQAGVSVYVLLYLKAHPSAA